MQGFQIYLNEEFTKKYDLPFCGLIAEGRNHVEATVKVRNYFINKFNIDKADVEQIIKIIGTIKPIEIDENDTKILSMEERYKYEY